MERWAGKIAVVTGASSGIGAAIAVDLVKAGMIVIGLARRKERIDELREQLPENLRANLHAIRCDVSKEEEIVATFAEIEKLHGGVDVLINNAGIGRPTTLMADDNSVALREVMDTNVFGLVFCTREAIRSMKQRGDNGHIVHINSLLGHYMPFFVGIMPSLNIYPASKYAVTALTESLRQELIECNSKIKVTSISPGVVKTEIIIPEVLKKMEENNTSMLEAEDISQGVLYVLGTPPRVQVHELTIKPVGERF